MTACKRAWEVEAARDGRLGVDEREDLDKHLATCATCRDEKHELDVLGERLCSLPALAADDLSIRRARKRVLERANDQRYGARGGKPGSLGAVARAAFVAACLVGVMFGLGRMWQGQHAKRGPEVAFEADPDTRYRTSEQEGAFVVELTHGRLTLHIRDGQRDHGVLVRTPDGELEDVGTVFTVDVEGGRTRYVGVREGRVLMRLKSRDPRILEAGESVRPYDSVVQPPAPDVTPLPAHAEPPPVPHKRSGRARAGERTPHRRSAHVTTDSGEPAPDAGADLAAQEFTAAVARLDAGDLASAASLLHRFVRRHPDDVRAEDATFLRVVALTRADQIDEARAAADAYLSHYPAGFRVKEVERLLRDLVRAGSRRAD